MRNRTWDDRNHIQGEDRMKKILSALAVLALATTARALFPATAHADSGAYWGQVCCGSYCPTGDYCLGSGHFTCCK